NRLCGSGGLAAAGAGGETADEDAGCGESGDGPAYRTASGGVHGIASLALLRADAVLSDCAVGSKSTKTLSKRYSVFLSARSSMNPITFQLPSGGHMALNEPGARAATLSDVARRAGVSIATASKALNDRGDVAAATRAKVLAVAAELSFTPNAMAKGLLAGRTGTVGLLTSDLEGRFMIPILMGAEDAFGAGRINVFLCDARGDAIREQHHLRELLSRRVDGIIVVGRQTDPRPSLGQEIPVPVVYAYAPSDDPRDPSLTPDNVAGGRLAVEHLIACGRTRIAHITG